MPRYVEEFTDVNMSYRDYENWRNETLIANEERLELLDEVKAGEGRESALHDQIRYLEDKLILEQSHYTLGGTPPGYHEPGAWANRAQPPPSASDESAPPLKRGLS
jgi:hypothetical protein